jgi:hypothetical protein
VQISACFWPQPNQGPKWLSNQLLQGAPQLSLWGDTTFAVPAVNGPFPNLFVIYKIDPAQQPRKYCRITHAYRPQPNVLMYTFSLTNYNGPLATGIYYRPGGASVYTSGGVGYPYFRAWPYVEISPPK